MGPLRCERHEWRGSCYVQRDGSHVGLEMCICRKYYSRLCPIDQHQELAKLTLTRY